MESDLVLVCVLIVGAGAACMKDEGPDAVEPRDGSSADAVDGVSDSSGKDRVDLDAADDGAGAADGSDVSVADADGPDEGDVAVTIDAAPELPEARDLATEESPTDLMNGRVCQYDSWCISGFCVDGVCCDTACEADQPMGCRACLMVRTGQRDGICAIDHSRERAKCGEACGQLVTNVPSVLEMICVQGRCTVPEAPTIVETCRKDPDGCTTSFCNQATNRTARCVHSMCPQPGTCCCESPGDVTARSCVATNVCTAGRACVLPGVLPVVLPGVLPFSDSR